MKNHKLLEVDLVNVREYNQELGDNLESRPAEYLPLVRHTVSAQYSMVCSLSGSPSQHSRAGCGRTRRNDVRRCSQQHPWV
jgi:hypothetical protein